MGQGRGHRQLIYYNYRGPRHYDHDCTNPTRESCFYCTQFDHETKDYPTLLAGFRDKGTLQPPPTQNLQMMRSKPAEEDPNVNVMLRSGITTRDDKDKQPKESARVHKAPTKKP